MERAASRLGWLRGAATFPNFTTEHTEHTETGSRVRSGGILLRGNAVICCNNDTKRLPRRSGNAPIDLRASVSVCSVCSVVKM